jgi:hypothetical protein
MNKKDEMRSIIDEFTIILGQGIEDEVKKRLEERLVQAASNEDPPKMPDIKQPFWYGHIRRRFGWARWKNTPYHRKLFISQLGELIIHQENIRRNRENAKLQDMLIQSRQKLPFLGGIINGQKD